MITMLLQKGIINQSTLDAFIPFGEWTAEEVPNQLILNGTTLIVSQGQLEIVTGDLAFDLGAWTLSSK
jgi:hypothetical protein